MEKNLEPLKQFLAAPENENFVAFIKSAKKHYPRTNLTSFTSLFKNKGLSVPTAEEARNFFKILDSLHFGQLVRYGSNYKFEWSATMSMPNLALTLAGLPIQEKEKGNPNTPIKSDTEKSKNLVHEFLLRPDFKLKIELPDNFSTMEANRLQLFIKTLPFQGE